MKRRSNLTPEQLRERARQTAWKRARQRKRWAQQAMACTTCPAKLSRLRICGWPLENRLIDGETVPFCAQCDRKARGICLDCRRAPVYSIGHALRCDACATLAVRRSSRLTQLRHPETQRRAYLKRKQRAQHDPAFAAAMREKARAYRIIDARHVHAKQRAAWQRTEKGRACAARKWFRHAERNREQTKLRERAKQRGEAWSHACVSCPTRLEGRRKKCEPCRQRDLAAAKRLIYGAAT